MADTTNRQLEKQVGQLEALLGDLLAAHEWLLAHLQQKRQALREADRQKVMAVCQLENQQVQAVAELEKERLKLVADLTLTLDSSATEPMRMADLAGRLPEPMRSRVLVLRSQLRQRMEDVRREAGVCRQATESLLRHMQGLMQTIGGVITGVGTYGRRGAPPKAALSVSTFNLTA